MDTQTLYREELLEHYRNPQNFGKLSNADISAKQSNPFCGDEIEMFVKFQGSLAGVKLDHLEGDLGVELSHKDQNKARYDILS